MHGPIHDAIDYRINPRRQAEVEANKKGIDRAVEGIDAAEPYSRMIRTHAGIQETQKLNTAANETRKAFIS